MSIEAAVAAVRREVLAYNLRDRAALTQEYEAQTRALEQREKEAEAEKERALEELRQTQERLNLNTDIAERAFEACRDSGDLEPVRIAFNRGGDTWEFFINTLSGLSLAIIKERALIVSFLLDKGVDYKKLGRTPLRPYEEVFAFSWKAVRTAAQQSMLDAMKNRVLKDVVQSSVTGNLGWFHHILSGEVSSIGLANELINAPIPDLGGLTSMMVLARDNHLAAIGYIESQGRGTIDFSKTDDSQKNLFDHAFEWGHKEFVQWIATKMVRNSSELETACVQGDLDAVNRLLQQGVDPAEKNNTPLIWAAMYGKGEVVVRLLATGLVDVHAKNNAAIVVAARFGYVNIARDLVEKGADIAARDNAAFALASAQNHQEMIAFLCTEKKEKQRLLDRPLLEAVFANNRSAVEKALANGASMNSVEGSPRACNPLQLAIVCCHESLAEFLATQPNINFAYKAKDDLNMTSLELAKHYGYSNLERIISTHPENMALLNAAAAGEAEKVEQALQDGADVQVTDSNGYNPLQLAILFHYKHKNATKVAEPLLTGGISRPYRSKIGDKTAHELAQEQGLSELAERIKP